VAPELQTSVQTIGDKAEGNGLVRDPRLLITVTTSSTTTLNLVSTTTNSSIIISLTVLCTAAGQLAYPACG